MTDKGNFLKNLIADLRDRHLLPVIGVLALAIVAVPFLLRSSAEPVVPPSPMAAPADSSEAIVPAVFTGTEGVRVYQKRLAALSEKNPFQDHFAPLATTSHSGSGSASVTTTPEPIPTVPTSSSSTTSGGGSSSTVSAGSGGSTSSASLSGGYAGTSSSTDTTNTSTTTTDVKVKHTDYVLTYQADLHVGPAGDAHDVRGVPELTFLPSDSRPAALFAGVTDDASQALFMLSTDVVKTSGEGQCLPKATDCQFIALKEGEQRMITYQPEGSQPHKIALGVTGINAVVVEKGKHASKHAGGATTPSGIAAWLGL